MSEPMQASDNSRYKGARFLEGRLRLSTSCNECHRRKQKCDQKQPCKHCSRRFPQPACVYRKLAADSKGKGQAKAERSYGDLPHENSERNLRNGAGIQINDFRFTEHNATIESSTNIKDKEPVMILSTATIDKFDARSYQKLLSNMVAVMSLKNYRQNSESEEPQQEKRYGFLLHGFNNGLNNKQTGAFPSSPSFLRKTKYEHNITPPSRFSITSVDPLHYLGVTPTAQSSELLHAFLTIISKYVVSIDGIPPPNNFYNTHFLPWAIKSPLLTLIEIMTAACYQAEILQITPAKSPIVLGYKLEVIKMLNAIINEKEEGARVSNEAITAVVYLTTNEWYWDNEASARMHMRGLGEMVRVRGGLGAFEGSGKGGMDGFVRKLVILQDYYLSLTYSLPLHFPHPITIPLYSTYPISLSTPFLPSSTSFLSIAAALGIHSETARILDDMRFLFSMFYSHIVKAQPSTIQKRKFETTTVWILDRLMNLQTASSSDLEMRNDPIHQSILLTSLIYTRALSRRIPLSSPEILLPLPLSPQPSTLPTPSQASPSPNTLTLPHIFTTLFATPLSTWKSIPSLLLYTILAVLPLAQGTPYARFLKSVLKTGSAFIGLENWEVVDGVLGRGVELQRWLRSVDKDGQEEGVQEEWVGGEEEGENGHGSLRELDSSENHDEGLEKEEEEEEEEDERVEFMHFYPR